MRDRVQRQRTHDVADQIALVNRGVEMLGVSAVRFERRKTLKPAVLLDVGKENVNAVSVAVLLHKDRVPFHHRVSVKGGVRNVRRRPVRLFQIIVGVKIIRDFPAAFQHARTRQKRRVPPVAPFKAVVLEIHVRAFVKIIVAPLDFVNARRSDGRGFVNVIAVHPHAETVALVQTINAVCTARKRTILPRRRVFLRIDQRVVQMAVAVGNRRHNHAVVNVFGIRALFFDNDRRVPRRDDIAVDDGVPRIFPPQTNRPPVCVNADSFLFDNAHGDSLAPYPFGVRRRFQFRLFGFRLTDGTLLLTRQSRRCRRARRRRLVRRVLDRRYLRRAHNDVVHSV